MTSISTNPSALKAAAVLRAEARAVRVHSGRIADTSIMAERLFSGSKAAPFISREIFTRQDAIFKKYGALFQCDLHVDAAKFERYHAFGLSFVASGIDDALIELGSNKELVKSVTLAINYSSTMTDEARQLLEAGGYFLKELGQTGTYLLGRRGKDEAALAELKEFLEKPKSGLAAKELITGFFGIRVYSDNRLTENGWGELHHMLLAGKQEDLRMVGGTVGQALIRPGHRLSEIYVDSIFSVIKGLPYVLYNHSLAGGDELNIPSSMLNNGTSFISVTDAVPGPELPTDLELSIAALHYNQGRPT